MDLFKERFCYGMGDFGCNILYIATSSFLLFYYTDYAGVNAAAVGTIMLISRILDAFASIIMGIIVDRTKSKYGKARVWLLRMSLPLAISSILMFSVPMTWSQGTKLIYIFLTYNLSTTVFYTAVNLPYSSLNALMTQDSYERSVLTIFRNFLATGGGLLINMMILPMVDFFGDNMVAWTKTMGVLSIIFTISVLISFLGTKERVHAVSQSEETISLKKSLLSFLHNKYGLMLTGVFIFLFIFYAMNGGTTVYFAKDVLGDKNLVNVLNGFSNVIQLAALFLIARLIRHFGKRNVFVIGLFLETAGLLLLDLYGSSACAIWIGSAVRGVGNGCFGATMWAMLSDTIDYGEWKTGCRLEGFTNSAVCVGYKIGNGIGSALLGLILSLGGYTSGRDTQPDSAILAIHLSFTWISILTFIVIFVILRFYKLDEQFDEIVKDLRR